MQTPDQIFDMRPNLESDRVRLRPLARDDFAELFGVASDPQLWAQHPVLDRWREPVFRRLFEDSMEFGRRRRRDRQGDEADHWILALQRVRSGGVESGDRLVLSFAFSLGPRLQRRRQEPSASPRIPIRGHGQSFGSAKLTLARAGPWRRLADD